MKLQVEQQCNTLLCPVCNSLGEVKLLKVYFQFDLLTNWMEWCESYMQCIETSGETTLLGKVEMTTFITHLHYKHQFKPCTVLKHSVAGACFHLLHLIVFIIIFMKTFWTWKYMFMEKLLIWESCTHAPLTLSVLHNETNSTNREKKKSTTRERARARH